MINYYLSFRNNNDTPNTIKSFLKSITNGKNKKINPVFVK